MRPAVPNNHKPPRQIHPLPQRPLKRLDTPNPSVVSTQTGPESHPDRIASRVVTSSQATATPIRPTQPHFKVTTLPSMLLVARNDITALHRFDKEGSEDPYTDDSYGGGFKTPSIHTDCSGPPAPNSGFRDYPMARDWHTAGIEIHCPSDEAQDHKSDQPNSERDDARIDEADLTSNNVTKRGGGEDDDSLYNASINGSNDKTAVPHATDAAFNFSSTPKPSPSRYKNNNHNHNHHETQTSNHAYSSPNSVTKPSNKALVHYHSNNNTHSPDPDPMPALTPCNPGCAVCTVLLPAMKCVACRKVQYCSATCQRADWKEHKVVCKAQVQARDRVNGNGVGL